MSQRFAAKLNSVQASGSMPEPTYGAQRLRISWAGT